METKFFKLREKISNLCKVLNFIALILHYFKIYPEPTWIMIMILSLLILLNSGWNLWRCPKENPDKEACKADLWGSAGILMVFGTDYLFCIILLGVICCIVSIIKQIKYVKMQIKET